MNDKKELIFKSALKLFTTNGFHGTPTSLIAKEAGVATGTLFHYFKTKEELINNLYLECKDSMVIFIMESINTKDDIYMYMKSIHECSIRWGIKKSEEYLFLQHFENCPHISKLTREEGYNKTKTLSDPFVKAQTAGILKDMDTELLFDICWGIAASTIRHIFSQNLQNERMISEIIDQSFAVLYDAIKA